MGRANKSDARNVVAISVGFPLEKTERLAEIAVVDREKKVRNL